jgi:hypothetical protein
MVIILLEHQSRPSGSRGEYLHELATFPKGKNDDQADSTSQALDWFKNQSTYAVYGLIEYWKQEALTLVSSRAAGHPLSPTSPRPPKRTEQLSSAN